MAKKLILAMAILGTIFACKSKEKATDQQNGGNVSTNVEKKELPTMPEGRLLRVTYSYQGMMMEEFGNYDLQRHTDGKPSTLSFRYRGDDVSYVVSDTLFDAARRIIEEERMYEYDSYYSLKMDERILDGYRWDFDAWFEGDKCISTGGHHVSPKGDGLNKISTLLRNAARQLVEADKKE